jgi:F-type H+-transporting ATPase subunit delta
MSEVVLVGKYAKAFGEALGYSKESCLLVSGLCRHLRDYYELPEVKEIIASKVVPLDLKKSLLDYALSRFTQSPELAKAIKVLKGSGRFYLLLAVTTEYLKQADQLAGVVEAKVTSVVALGVKQQQLLQKTLENIFKKKVRLLLQEDSSLLGGLVVRVGEDVFDLSLHRRIERLSTQLLV